MSNVKTIGGAIVNTAGVALLSKTVTLKNDDTGATITTTTTNADGEWEFANRDETLRYRAEAAFGGSSSQVVVRKPASAEFDHLYANSSFRTAAGATTAIGGAMSLASSLTMTATNASIELGNPSVGNTPLFDFHSSGTGNDYDVRLIASAGAVDIGLGRLDIVAQTLVASGTLTLASSLTASAGVHTLTGATTNQTTNPATVPLVAKGALAQSVSIFEVRTSADAVIAAVGMGGLTVSAATTLTGATTITTTNPVTVPLVAKGAAAQTASIFEVRTSTNAVVASVSPSGNATITGTLTAADVTASTVGANTATTGTLVVSSNASVAGVTTLATTTVTGVLTVPNGSLGTASPRYAGDTDTGPYLSAADNYRIQAGGTDCATFAKIGGFAYFSIPGRFALTPDGSSAATPANVSGRYPLYNAGGAVIGYIPIYATL